MKNLKQSWPLLVWLAGVSAAIPFLVMAAQRPLPSHIERRRRLEAAEYRAEVERQREADEEQRRNPRPYPNPDQENAPYWRNTEQNWRLID